MTFIALDALDIPSLAKRFDTIIDFGVMRPTGFSEDTTPAWPTVYVMAASA